MFAETGRLKIASHLISGLNLFTISAAVACLWETRNSRAAFTGLRPNFPSSAAFSINKRSVQLPIVKGIVWKASTWQVGYFRCATVHGLRRTLSIRYINKLAAVYVGLNKHWHPTPSACQAAQLLHRWPTSSCTCTAPSSYTWSSCCFWRSSHDDVILANALLHLHILQSTLYATTKAVVQLTYSSPLNFHFASFLNACSRGKFWLKKIISNVYVNFGKKRKAELFSEKLEMVVNQ